LREHLAPLALVDPLDGGAVVARKRRRTARRAGAESSMRFDVGRVARRGEHDSGSAQERDVECSIREREVGIELIGIVRQDRPVLSTLRDRAGLRRDAAHVGAIVAQHGVRPRRVRDLIALFYEVPHRVEPEAITPISLSQNCATRFISSDTAGVS